jgi:chromosome partitioning protein
MARIIAVANQKGGVGKTTTVANVGGALVEEGEKVLLVDLDPRADLSSYFGVNPREGEATTYEAIFAEGVGLGDVAVEVGEKGLRVAAADMDLAGAALVLGEMRFAQRQRVVREAIGKVAEEHDFVLIDLAPGLELLSVAGLGAADEVIIPQQCSFLALHGLRQVEATIARLQEANRKLKVCGILLTMHDRRTVHHREVIEMVREGFGDLVFETVIPQTIRLQDAAIAHEPISEYDPRSEVAELYRAVVREVLERG